MSHYVRYWWVISCTTVTSLAPSCFKFTPDHKLPHWTSTRQIPCGLTLQLEIKLSSLAPCSFKYTPDHKLRIYNDVTFLIPISWNFELLFTVYYTNIQTLSFLHASINRVVCHQTNFYSWMCLQNFGLSNHCSFNHLFL